METESPGYSHLCVHSHFSFLSSTASIHQLVDRAVQEGHTHLALTDSNALYGAASFAQTCLANYIEPITGMCVSISPPRLEGFELPGMIPGQLVLLAKNRSGYRSLCKLSTLIQGNPHREAAGSQEISLETLQQFNEGLFCISGGQNGWIDRTVRKGDPQAAYRFAARLAILFGSDNVALALEIHRPEDETIASEIHSLANRLALRCCALHPIHCLDAGDRSLFKLCTAIKLNCSIDDVPLEIVPGHDDPQVSLHWPSIEEMSQTYANFPQALAESNNIARICEYALPEKRFYFPAIDIPLNIDADQFLSKRAHEGMVEKYGSDPIPEIQLRLERELNVIAQYGFSPLFLVVADIVAYARQASIPISSRGSVANSLAAYCAGITNVDPIEHDLLFERFLSPARADMPDIDLDFCSRRRDEILNYVREKYGSDHVALVGTICTMRFRSAVRETAKAYRLDDSSINRLVKNLPHHYHPGARRKKSDPEQELLAGTRDPFIRKIIKQAARLVGLPHHLGVHPGGVIITPCPLTDLVPLQWATKGFLTTQYDHNYLEFLGLPKLDLLGVSALTVLADAAGLVRDFHNVDFQLDEIPCNDIETAGLLCRGDTVGVFQCESQGARSTLRKLQAHNIRDLAVANAFFKPGPRLGGMANTFVRRYRGEEGVSYVHPRLEPILGHTKGVLIFQEQVLRVAREIAGLSWPQAGQLRRGMSKMKAETMREIQDAFIRGCQVPETQGPGMTTQQAQTLWEQVSAFSGYGFNQGHATAYAAVSYKMAYLKRYYPAALFCARLANWGGFHHPAVYMVEAMLLGMAIHPPHINHSRQHFYLTWENEIPQLWMGLGQVRDLRNHAIEQIIEQAQIAPFTSLRDLLARVRLQDREITHLIKAGALNELGENRNSLLAEKDDIRQAGNALQLPLFSDSLSFHGVIEPESRKQQVSWEMNLLGYPISMLSTPLEVVEDKLPASLISFAQLDDIKGRPIDIAAMRIPGWTGGDGFYLWDGNNWIIAKMQQNERNPKSWHIVYGRGRWLSDEWGSAWLQLDDFSEMSAW